MDVNTNDKMSTPISQLINKSETEINSESIPDIVITPDSPVELLNTNAINYNQDIHTNTIKSIQQTQPINNQIFSSFLEKINKIADKPVIIFPGNNQQISQHADGIFLLS